METANDTRFFITLFQIDYKRNKGNKTYYLISLTSFHAFSLTDKELGLVSRLRII